ncbi:hypothetical protein K439DRAFT_1636904 [Ramaria rubella]|nr:hypothetical protein K439DRAFT_1636904 [Ramaria rubella]
MDDVPSYATVSPVGVHILDIPSFLHSSHKAPLSTDPGRRGWASEESMSSLSQIFLALPLGQTTFELFIYNKTRDIDRICPSCRRWYRVGETLAFDPDGTIPAYRSFEEFIRRPICAIPPSEENNKVTVEQELSGICSSVCMGVMNNGDESMLGLDYDELTPEQLSRCSASVERDTGWRIRKTTAEEEVSMGGVKVVYYKV